MSVSQRKSSVPYGGFELSQHPEGKILEDEKKFGKSDIHENIQRRYNSHDEFVCLLYNDIADIFLKKWSKTSELPKSILVTEFRENLSSENDEVIKDEETENEKSIEKKGEGLNGLDSSNSKLFLPDEYIEIEFPNKNIYMGNVSRKQMEGYGVYRWGSGEMYKGEFDQNLIQGKGNLEWKDQSWYEGEFDKGNRHGSGNLVSHGYGRFYIGQWTMGRKNGNGYCRYGKNDDFYDGEWKMDKKDGNGYRLYENGTRYIGKWEDDQRNGIGTMIWPNGDVYHGEWKNGKMNGYGDYVWNGFFNRSFSWPQENSYMGEWLNGMRHGKGILKLNSTGGGKYSGNWCSDKKHGYGMIIGNNGVVTEADPLFIENILIPVDKDSKLIMKKSKEELEDFSTTKKEIKHKKPRIIKLFEPLHLLSLSFYVQRLLNKKKYYYSQKISTVSIRSGKCLMCENKSSCICLLDHSENLVSKSTTSSDKKSSSNLLDDLLCDNHEKSETELKNRMGFTEKEYEEHWVYNCLQNYMPNLRKVYKLYAELYCDEKEILKNLSMGKIGLWQLMRDCGLNRRGISLVQLQRYISSNKSAFINTEFDPFERIEFFQFIHSLLEISWHIYTKLDNIETDLIRGRLAGGLYRLLIKDIFPNAGKYIGNFSKKLYRDLLPIYSVYKLYCEIGEPHTAKMLLRASCVLKGTIDPKSTSSPIPDKALIINGINAINICEKLRFIPLDKELIRSDFSERNKNCEDVLGRELFAFRHIGAEKFLSIISSICPSIKDQETDMIVYMDYELTFLEFYEILIEATRVFINMKKLSESSII